MYQENAFAVFDITSPDYGLADQRLLIEPEWSRHLIDLMPSLGHSPGMWPQGRRPSLFGGCFTRGCSAGFDGWTGFF